MGSRYRSGNWVLVKSAREIAQTLDANGALDGLPFMPEMVELSGRRFRVARRAEKTCVEYSGGNYKVREFRNNDVVVLETSRCSGTDHDGCQRACTFFWKSAWLDKWMPGQMEASSDADGMAFLRSRLKAKSSPGRYYCQSTELDKATQFLPRSKVILKCLSEVFSGSRSIFEMAQMVAVPIWKFGTSWVPRQGLKGKLKKTPVGNLGLQAGELVTVRSESEIADTLDERGCNRGLKCDLGMTQYGGGQYEVRNRLDRMIAEPTGEMRSMKGTVILEGLHCICWWNHLGGCPRQDYMYWREIWLDRVSQPKGIFTESEPQMQGPAGSAG